MINIRHAKLVIITEKIDKKNCLLNTKTNQ